MPRAPSPKTNEFPIHVSARCNNKEHFFEPMQSCWEIFIELLNKVCDDYEFQTHAFTLMGNHYHWLLSTPLSNLGEGMMEFQTKSSLRIAGVRRRQNRIYGGRYKPTIIESPLHFKNTFRYVLQNPIRAKLVTSVTDYKWSSHCDSRIKIVSSKNFEAEIPRDPIVYQKWLDSVPPEKFNRSVRTALRRSTFKFPRQKGRGKVEHDKWV